MAPRRNLRTDGKAPTAASDRGIDSEWLSIVVTRRFRSHGRGRVGVSSAPFTVLIGMPDGRPCRPRLQLLSSRPVNLPYRGTGPNFPLRHKLLLLEASTTTITIRFVCSNSSRPILIPPASTRDCRSERTCEIDRVPSFTDPLASVFAGVVRIGVFIRNHFIPKC